MAEKKRYDIVVMEPTTLTAGLRVVESLSASGLYKVRALVGAATLRNLRGYARHISELPSVSLVSVDYGSKDSVTAAIRGADGVYLHMIPIVSDTEEYARRGKLVADVCKEEDVRWVVCDTWLREGKFKDSIDKFGPHTFGGWNPAVDEHLLSLGLQGMFHSTSVPMEIFAGSFLTKIDDEGDILVKTPAYELNSHVPVNHLGGSWGQTVLGCFNFHFYPTTLPLFKPIPGRTYSYPTPSDPSNVWWGVADISSNITWGEMLDALKEEVRKAEEESGALEERGGRVREVKYQLNDNPEEVGAHWLGIWRHVPNASGETAQRIIPTPEFEGVDWGLDWPAFCRENWVPLILEDDDN